MYMALILCFVHHLYIYIYVMITYDKDLYEAIGNKKNYSLFMFHILYGAPLFCTAKFVSNIYI